jgi:5,10-methylenetetrahydromethanopterin reductase
LVKFGIEFVPREVYWKIMYYVIQAERGGFSNLWITDHFNNRNVYATLAAASIYTNRITLGPGVTNPYMVNPVSTAQTVATLEEMAPGRVVLGIGAGDKTTLDTVGVEMRMPLAAIQESIAIIRGMLNGESVSHQGEVFRTSGAKFLFKTRKIPVYVGAQGPKMLALAGKIGDGVLINACHPKDVELAVGCVKEGLNESGKKPDEVDIAAYTAFSVHQDLKKANKAAVPPVSFIVAGCPPQLLERHGISVGKAGEIKEALKANDWGRAFGEVTPEMINAFSVCGTPEMCTERIAELLKSGITQFVVGSPIGLNVREAIELVSREIMPHFKT